METVSNKTYLMFFNKMYLLPLLFYTVFPCMYVILYIFCFEIEYLPAKLPYLSQTTCSWFMNMMIGTSILLGASVLYVRYKQVQKFSSLLPERASLETVNRCAVVLAAFAIAALLITITLENLKLNTPLLDYIATICFFSFGTFYFILQQNISERCLCLELYACAAAACVSRRRCLLRVNIVSLTFLTLAASISMYFYADINFAELEKMSSVPGHRGALLLALMLSQYVCVVTFTLYMLSYQRDFNMFSHLYYVEGNIFCSEEIMSHTVSQTNSLNAKIWNDITSVTMWNNKANKNTG